MPLAVSASTISLPSSSLSAREQKMLDRDQQKLRDARSAVETLKARGANRSQEAADQRKAQARKKVEQLKALLKMMQMGGPANARAVTQIARELKAAVQAYGGAGGSTADLGAAAGTQAPAGETGVTQDGAPAAGSSEQGAAGSALPQPGVEGASDGAATGDEAGTQTEAEAARAAQADPYRRLAEATAARAGEAARRGAEQEEDRKFVNEVRELTALLKSMARRAAQEAKADPSSRADAEEAMKAADAAARAVEKVSADLGAAGISISA